MQIQVLHKDFKSQVIKKNLIMLFKNAYTIPEFFLFTKYSLHFLYFSFLYLSDCISSVVPSCIPFGIQNLQSLYIQKHKAQLMVLNVLLKFWYSLLYEEFQCLSNVTCTNLSIWQILRHKDADELQSKSQCRINCPKLDWQSIDDSSWLHNVLLFFASLQSSWTLQLRKYWTLGITSCQT